MTMTRLTSETLHGVWLALLTPWTDADELDESCFADEIRGLAGVGLHGVYTGGTTGEFYAQDNLTFERITKIACHEAHALDMPIQIGCTTTNTRDTQHRIRFAVDAGADGIQVAMPYWLELNDREAIGFFEGVAKAAQDVPIIMYHTSRAKRKLPPTLIGQIVKRVPTLIGLKDSCDASTLRQILQEAGDVSIMGGEAEMLSQIPAGGRGTYSAIAGMNARLVLDLYEACVAGRTADARPLHDAITHMLAEVIIPMYEADGLNDSAVDRLFRELGGGHVGLRCRKPYLSPTAEHVDRLARWCTEHASMLLALEPPLTGNR